mmetsp:Transcript_13367/g.15327  ORF Transcript_13367/g.15327 Transcript_13367/m.15327 type:complete len:680 (+) Transcript_13367:29-2068(+)|eukprot:CAMPEP_0194154088 /NCGR_PEP_ID=MMETSP0152-20130528/59142_1 /TAXON_ID=1049557 /ORGANISM="Thalassiothrix antarctica, Strain L6-D1" /LENGTH=679 /DNA_ID=CAMNT_0038859889 /DNA_START=119 /DNA_END=2158 /DNA_ORIENTATION=+
MGCKLSKTSIEGVNDPPTSPSSSKIRDEIIYKNPDSFTSETTPPRIKERWKGSNGAEEIYHLLSTAKEENVGSLYKFWPQIKDVICNQASVVSYTHPKTRRTALHLACCLIDLDDGTEIFDSKQSVVASIRAMIKAYPKIVISKDAKGNLPIHYVLSPRRNKSTLVNPRYRVRAEVLKALLTADDRIVKGYLSKNDAVFSNETSGVTPLYHALQTLSDDFDPEGFTLEYIKILHEIVPNMMAVSNISDNDTPLALLYRRFTRQFDLSEKFFPGDNSRQQVVEHRYKYRTAAGNTWKIIEELLKPVGMKNAYWKMVHRAIQVETPPDLLRYIVETNAEELTMPDDDGNLPLHYAAKSVPPMTSFPEFYTKYVVDELLYKFPEAASTPDAAGRYPLALAIETEKQWIGGGMKSLYDAFPAALGQINLDSHKSLRRALSFEVEEKGEEKIKKEEEPTGIIRDEPHDAIMLVQRDDVKISEVVSAMWAHEEDAGVQMLGCVAIVRLARSTRTNIEKLRIALSAVAAIVNAMKAHPNEPIVQEKACGALNMLTCADGNREVSFIASGAIAAVVGAMQAHVVDATVQQEACAAIAEIMKHGGSERVTVVGSVSGVTAIVNALAAHPDVEGVQVEGCRALKIVTDFPQANIPKLSKLQLEPLVESAKTDFPSCEVNTNILLSRLSS